MKIFYTKVHDGKDPLVLVREKGIILHEDDKYVFNPDTSRAERRLSEMQIEVGEAYWKGHDGTSYPELSSGFTAAAKKLFESLDV